MSEFHPRKYPFSPMAELKLCPEYDDIRPEEPITPIIAPYGEGRAWLAIGYDEAKAVFVHEIIERVSLMHVALLQRSLIVDALCKQRDN